MKAKKRLLIVALAALLLAVLAPRRAYAFDTTPIIISGAIAGGVLVIGLIAILVAGGQEDEDLKPIRIPATTRDPYNPGQIRFLRDCPLAADSRPLACW